MKAAAETFRERGLDGASLNEIAKRAGLDRASIYYYAASKEDLYRALVEETVRANVESVSMVRDGEGSGAEKLALTIRLLMKSYEEHYPHLFIFVAEDFGRLGPQTRQGRKASASPSGRDWRGELSALGECYHICVRDIVKEGYEDGSLQSALSPGIVAHGVIGMVNASHRWFNPSGPATGEDVAAGYVEMVLSGLRPARRRATTSGRSAARPPKADGHRA